MPANLSCGAAVAGLLEQYGVDTVFGIPGVHTLELYRGLAGSSIRHILARHEQGAGFMADGYARASGRPGVCFVITGPGVTNIATPMGQAFSDSVPMLVISSANDGASLGKGLGDLHEITDQQAVAAPLTGASYLAESPGAVVERIGDAFAAFAAGRPRPVHVAAPINVLAMPADGAWKAREPELSGPRPPKPDDAAAACAALQEAERPVLLLGGGARHVSQAAMTRLAEALGAIVLTTRAGKGIVPESHPLSVGGTMSLRASQEILAAADVTLVLGSELSETDSYATGRLELGEFAIHVDIEPRDYRARSPRSLSIESDAAEFVAALGDLSSALPQDRQIARAAETRARNDDSWGELAQLHRKFLAVMREVLPRDGFVVSDMTQIAYTGIPSFPVDRAGCWFHPSGFGTLGYALPAAIGAMLAQPGRPGLALAGDFGFQFTLQELGTAVELGLSLPIVLWNNDYLGQICDDMVASGIPEVGVKARNPDFQALARAYGSRAERPGSLDAFGVALHEALQAEGPTLIEVRPETAG